MNPPSNVARSWNVAPNQPAMVVRRHPETGERHLDLPTWGFLPHWAVNLKAEHKPINTKAETVATTPMFRAAFAHNRCLLPTDAYYDREIVGSGGSEIAEPGRNLPVSAHQLGAGWCNSCREVVVSTARTAH